jgi:uncharacterized protein YbaA (DUF1428 family)
MYIDGFLLAVPTAKKEEYRKHAESAIPIFKEFGMTRMVEAWGDDIPDGKVTDFKRAVKAKDDETVVFSWCEYPDKQTRDAANEKMRSDPRMAEMGEMPFDGKRMIYSGFAPIVEKGSDTQAGYIDGFVIPVPVKRQSDYKQVAEAAAPVFIDHGATGVVEAWGEDLMKGEVTDYYKAVEATEDEGIIFSWIAWPSKEARDSGNKAAMEDERFAAMGPESMPFDGKRMIFGGFVPIVDQ